MSHSFTAEEERALREALRTGTAAPPCPRCGERLDTERIPSPRAVSYVRERVMVRCPRCDLRSVVDGR